MIHFGHLDYRLYERIQVYIHGDYARQKAILGREFDRHAAEAPDRAACRVLELACGGGSLADAFPPERYLGIDRSSGRIEAARRGHPRHRFEAGDVTGPDLEGRLADADFVFCHGLLHHLDDGECRALVAAVRNLARKPATLVAIEPLLPEPWLNPAGFLVGKMDEGRFFRPDRGYRPLFGGQALRTESFSLFPRLPLRMTAYVARFA